MSAVLHEIDGAPFLDFQRYAPAPKPVVVWSQETIPAPAEPDELALVWQTMRTAAGIIWRGIGIALYITALRAANWCEDNILRSLSASWALAGLGWGGFVGISIIQYFAR
jgi:hypothetical protein